MYNFLLDSSAIFSIASNNQLQTKLRQMHTSSDSNNFEIIGYTSTDIMILYFVYTKFQYLSGLFGYFVYYPIIVIWLIYWSI